MQRHTNIATKKQLYYEPKQKPSITFSKDGKLVSTTYFDKIVQQKLFKDTIDVNNPLESLWTYLLSEEDLKLVNNKECIINIDEELYVIVSDNKILRSDVIGHIYFKRFRENINLRIDTRMLKNIVKSDVINSDLIEIVPTDNRILTYRRKEHYLLVQFVDDKIVLIKENSSKVLKNVRVVFPYLSFDCKLIVNCGNIEYFNENKVAVFSICEMKEKKIEIRVEEYKKGNRVINVEFEVDEESCLRANEEIHVRRKLNVVKYEVRIY